MRSEGGIALLEFALVLPILLLLYVGTVEVANLMSNLRKLDLFTRTVGDFAGGASAPSRQEIDGMFKASKVVLMPFDTEKVEIVVSAVGVIGTAASGPMQVCSSVAASNATPRAVREIPAVAPPAELRVRGARMLLVETRMPYQPRTGSLFTSLVGQSLSGVVFSRQMYWPVGTGLRYHSQAPEIVLPNGEACPPS
ncbi:TadE/TadG family type IV pilus assembly protein [uncultured Methylobacterium sp.]|uniref:TadE/TadG family type IV pilus assembly protein n=1 Tax=uncultured Methylobacterium sp. TaxID=157278 RepID=UPI0035CB731A